MHSLWTLFRERSRLPMHPILWMALRLVFSQPVLVSMQLTFRGTGRRLAKRLQGMASRGHIPLHLPFLSQHQQDSCSLDWQAWSLSVVDLRRSVV